ncbi:hypothetical protein L3X38_035111 [Prunus dulcis]|uniref:Uncharacterized protein n=1 Tax=Prunus dulcis TaxID=3755 RepID=A0AAD4VKT3_PRUDU|nr:hypothetical protein L3X38_035111 [Prunus dulcis]
MLETKPVITPIDCKAKLGLDGELLAAASYYLRLVGRIIYLTINRPDIYHAGAKLTGNPSQDIVPSLEEILVRWKSKKQSVIARSNAETEYRGMAAVSCELIWLQRLLNDLGFKDPHPMTLFCDNQAAIHIASHPMLFEHPTPHSFFG